MSMFDLISGLLGQSDPRQQLAARLNPTTVPPVAPAGTPNAGGDGGAAPPPSPGAAPSGGAPTPPTPAALQSQPDQAAANAKLANPLGPMPGAGAGQITPEMMLQMYDRARRENDFNSAMAGFVHGAYPGRTSAASMAAMIGRPQDPGQMFNALMGLQQYQQEQGARQAMWDTLPKIAKENNISLDDAKALFMSGKLPDVIAMNAGVGGDPTIRAMRTFEKNWDATHRPDETKPYEFGDVVGFQSFRAEEQAGKTRARQQTEDEISSGQEAAPMAIQTNQAALDNLIWLKQHKDATIYAAQHPWLTAGAAVGAPVGAPSGAADAAVKLDFFRQGKYADVFKGTHNVRTANEAANLSSSTNQINWKASPDAIGDELDRQIKIAQTNLANSKARGGQQLTPTEWDAADSLYKPGGRFFANATKGESEPTPSGGGQVAGDGGAPVTIKSDAEFDKLPSGTVFVGPDGKARRKP